MHNSELVFEFAPDGEGDVRLGAVAGTHDRRILDDHVEPQTRGHRLLRVGRPSRWTLQSIFLFIYFIIPWANVVSGMVENLRRKKFSPARIGVGGCRLSVCPSVCPSTLLCRITFEPVELFCWNFGSLPNSSQVIFWYYFGNPRTVVWALGPRGGVKFPNLSPPWVLKLGQQNMCQTILQDHANNLIWRIF
jgi:hypothetical protein